MLAALEESTRAQRQLVADASHELRTPLTSVRTNIEVLAGDRTLPPEERTRLLSDVVEQLGEMTTLISELIELARAEQQTRRVRGRPARPARRRCRRAGAPEPARGRLLRSSSSRRRCRVSRRRSSVPSGTCSTTRRSGARLAPQIEVEASRRDRSTVRDHGPGIADEDLPYVFDRFYRARAARGMPGSGPRPRDRASGRRVARRRRRRRASRRWRDAHGADARRAHARPS